MTIKCKCGHQIEISQFDKDVFIECCICLSQIKVAEISQFGIGESVIFYNHDHVWHNELALVRDTKVGFVRLELLGKLIWVPSDWVHRYDADNIT